MKIKTQILPAIFMALFFFTLYSNSYGGISISGPSNVNTGVPNNYTFNITLPCTQFSNVGWEVKNNATGATLYAGTDGGNNVTKTFNFSSAGVYTIYLGPAQLCGSTTKTVTVSQSLTCNSLNPQFYEYLQPMNSNDIINSNFALPFDFNNDGLSDMFVSYKVSGTNFLFKSNGGGTFTSISNPGSTSAFNGSPDNVLAGDFNGDNNQDLFVYWKATGANSIQLSNSPTNTFTSVPTPISTSNISGSPDYVIVGDFNSDNYDDLFFFWKVAGTNRLLINNQNNTFTLYNPIATTDINGSPDFVIPGDYNADGRTDLYFIWKTTGVNRLYIANATVGTFTYSSNPISTAALNGSPDYIIPAKFDSDAKTDLFVGWKTSGANILFISLGSTFTQYNSAANTASINGNPDYVVAANLSSSTKSDLYVHWKATGENKILKSTGTSFTSVNNYIPICATNGSPDGVITAPICTSSYSTILFLWRPTGINRMYSAYGAISRMAALDEDNLSTSSATKSKAYPNPIGKEITFEFQADQAAASSIALFNSLGEKVVELNGNSTSMGLNTQTFMLPDLKEGVYFYQISIGGKQVSSGTVIK